MHYVANYIVYTSVCSHEGGPHMLAFSALRGGLGMLGLSLHPVKLGLALCRERPVLISVLRVDAISHKEIRTFASSLSVMLWLIFL